MELYAKSALHSKQLDAKMKIGCDGIEIQLLDELVNGKLGSYFYAEEVFDLGAYKNYPISVIHAPLLGHFGIPDVNIESLMDSDFKLLDQVFFIANYYGKLQNKKVIVVIHSEMNRQTMMLISDTWKRVINGVGCLLFKYPYTELAIENVSPLGNMYKGDLVLRNNFKFDNITMAMELRKQLNTDRVGTVVDTCHSMITAKYMNLIQRDADCTIEDYSIEAFFKENRDVIKLIHLSDMADSGYGKGRHGIPFTEDTFDKLCNILSLYDKYEYSCPITLEVEETDFEKCDGYSKTKELVDLYLSGLSGNNDSK